MSLKGKVALVTGSTSGIGLGVARALAAKGADILMNGFGDAGSIERLRAELGRVAAGQAKAGGDGRQIHALKAEAQLPAAMKPACPVCQDHGPGQARAFGKDQLMVGRI